MRKLMAFTQVTLEGFFSGKNGDISWAHDASNDAEWKRFAEENAKSGGTLVFGRKTYELMVQYWPTPAALKNDPVVAEHMNAMPKVVFSKTLESVSWNNTRIVKGDIAGEIRKLKEQDGKHIAILGSGSIVAQLTKEGLIDEYEIVVFPVVIGEGRTVFDGLKEKLQMKLAKTRSFGNGNVSLSYVLS